jgi:hypothetical protein
MNNHRTDARESLNALTTALIRLGVKTNDDELLFLGHSLSTILRAAADETERKELKDMLSTHAVRRLMKAAGASTKDILIMEHCQTACAN